MAKKIYEVEYDDDLHLADASGSPDYKRGLLYDDEGNLKGHAKMREVDEDELRDRYSPDEQYSYDYSCNDYPQTDDVETPQLSEEDIEALVELGALIAGAIIAAAPHVKHWWMETAAPHLQGFFGSVSDFVQSKLPGKKFGSQPKQSDVALQVIDDSLKVDPKAVENELDRAYSAYRNDMSSEEAQKTLLEIVVLSALLAERIKKLSNANITVDRLERASLGWQDTIRQLTSDDLINGVNAILQSDSKLLTDKQLSDLELVLGRSLYKDGQYVPIDASALRNQLLPNSGDEDEDSGDSGDGPIHIPVQ